MSEQNQSQPQQELKVTASILLADLKAGLDRKAIAKKYDVSQAEVAEWFKAPSLKNRRVRPASKYTFVDDIDDAPKKVSAPKPQTALVAETAAVVDPSPATAIGPIPVVVEEANQAGDDAVNAAEAAASVEAPLPTGQISEVASADDSAEAADETTATKGLW